MSTYIEQAENFLKETGTTMTSRLLYSRRVLKSDSSMRDVYEVTFKRKSKKLTIEFGQALLNKGKQPTAYEVLANIQKEDPGTFKDFCRNFGYVGMDLDYKSEEYEIYRDLKKEYNGIVKIFGDVLDKLREIQ